jgi:hypothetical protein
MKKFFILLLLSTSFAYSFDRRIECRGRGGTQIEMVQRLGGGFWDTEVRWIQSGVTEFYRTSMRLLNSSINFRLRFIGGGDRLEIDTWPDRNPRRFRPYRSNFVSRRVPAGSTRGMNCEFTFF